MSWQPPSSNDGNAGGGGGGGGNANGAAGGNPGQQIGTEYTLQGVMRFLQTEWHRHERDRNSWEIERAEMKARIAKLEGENRAAKRLQQGSEARIKMLEMALKRERSAKQDASGNQDQSVATAILRPDNISLHPKANPLRSSIPPHKVEEARTKSRMYLEKCLQEITYLLTPPSHPPPQQVNLPLDPSIHPQANQLHPAPPGVPNHAYFEQMLAQNLSQPHKGNNQQPAQSDEHLQSPSSSLPHSQAYESRQQRRAYPQQQDERPHLQHHQPPSAISSIPEQMPERPLHPYNPFGQPPSTAEGVDHNPFSASSIESGSKESASDSWDFDESPSETSGKPGGRPATVGGMSETAPEQPWTGNRNYSSLKSGNLRIGSRGRKNSVSNSRKAIGPDSSTGNYAFNPAAVGTQRAADAGNFKVKFALRGHLDVVRAVCFTGGGTPAEPEICTAGDDGVIKRWYLPGTYGIHTSGDVDVQSHFTHRGHTGIITCLAACPPADGSASGDGWIFSGGQDSTIKVWERGRVEARATLIGHTDAVWSLCVLPTSVDGNFDRVLLVSGAADGTVKIWSVTARQSSPGRSASSSSAPSPANSIRGSISAYLDKQAGSGGSSGGLNQTPLSYTLVSTISRQGSTSSPTCICPFSITGENFIVSYDDATVIVYDTASGEEISMMASKETYDGTKATGVNAVVATTMSLPQFTTPTAGMMGAGTVVEGGGGDGAGAGDAGAPSGVADDGVTPAGATGPKGGLVGVVISGHEDRYIRFYDANSGQCTYTMLAHTSAISALALSPDGRELVSAGHDTSLRFWSMEKRTCIKEVPSHRLMRGEGVCTVVWSVDGRWVVSGGGDGVVKVFTR